jgi:hypothetical protein
MVGIFDRVRGKRDFDGNFFCRESLRRQTVVSPKARI